LRIVQIQIAFYIRTRQEEEGEELMEYYSEGQRRS
jgi:hypothetical protein